MARGIDEEARRAMKMKIILEGERGAVELPAESFRRLPDGIVEFFGRTVFASKGKRYIAKCHVVELPDRASAVKQPSPKHRKEAVSDGRP